MLISPWPTRSLLFSVLLLSLALVSALAEADVAQRPAVKVETLLQTNSSWDGVSYGHYPEGKPQLSVVRMTIPPRTTLSWHSHPMPNVAYVISGELLVEKRDGTLKKRITEGDVLAEMVDTVHRGVTGDTPVVLVVFYAGAEGLPLSEHAKNDR